MSTVEFHFDFGSPNAYLAHRMLPGVAQRTGGRFAYVPMLLGGVFRLTGNRSPMETNRDVLNKRDYPAKEIRRFVRRHRLEAFRFNPNFPVNTLAIMRGAVAMQQRDEALFHRYVEHVFQGMWEQEQKLDDPAVLHAWLYRGGFDADDLMQAAQSQPAKDGLMRNTQRSVDLGVFGAPSFVFEDEVYFGKDSLRDLADDMAAGHPVSSKA